MVFANPGLRVEWYAPVAAGSIGDCYRRGLQSEHAALISVYAVIRDKRLGAGGLLPGSLIPQENGL
jgi:hypothetical protein